MFNEMPLLDELYLIFFDHWIGQNIARDLIDLVAGFGAIRPRFKGNFEKLALTDGGYGSVSQACQSRPYGLALWIENGWLHGDVDACFHLLFIVALWDRLPDGRGSVSMEWRL